MNILVTQLRYGFFQRAKTVSYKLCCVATLAMFVLLSMLMPAMSFAEATAPQAIPLFTQVKESETQLAKRFELREAVESPFAYELGMGYRQDNLGWSIASGGVNIASEVNWKKSNIMQIRGAAKFNFWDGWQLRGVASSGAVKSGANRDSDYAGNNRTQEFLRSDNKTGGAVRDLSISLGRKFRFFESASAEGVQLVPQAGWSIHRQSLTMRDGQQTLPANGTLLTGLNNTYDTNWQGAWLGVDALLGLGDSVALTSTLEYHWVDYTADANWNLRNDLAHPISFKHIARGRGIVASVGATYRISRNFQLNVSLEQQRWSTATGYDQTFFVYGVTSYYSLNPVSWDSRSLMLTAKYQF